jgi:hypothetical protein
MKEPLVYKKTHPDQPFHYNPMTAVMQHAAEMKH